MFKRKPREYVTEPEIPKLTIHKFENWEFLSAYHITKDEEVAFKVKRISCNTLLSGVTKVSIRGVVTKNHEDYLLQINLYPLNRDRQNYYIDKTSLTTAPLPDYSKLMRFSRYIPQFKHEEVFEQVINKPFTMNVERVITLSITLKDNKPNFDFL